MFRLSPLPFDPKDLKPYMSEETVDFHYNKHHKGYDDNLKKLIRGTIYDKVELQEIMLSSSGHIFNNAAQVWNHNFFWNCLTSSEKSAKTRESGKLRLVDAITSKWEHMDNFEREFKEKAKQHFGSGYGWLVHSPYEGLSIVTTSNADNPLIVGDATTPILTVDLWEHSYYIDYRNERGDFLGAFFKLINWEFAEVQYVGVTGQGG